MLQIPGFVSLKNSYFLKIYKLFALFLLPVLFLGAISFLYINNGMIKEADRNYQDKVDRIQSAIDNNFSELVKMSSLIFTSVAMMDSERKLNSLSSYKEFKDMYALELIKFRDLLASSKEVKESLDSIFVYFPNTDLVITNEGIYDKNSYFQKYSLYQEYDVGYWSNIKNFEKYVTVLSTTKLYKNLITGFDPAAKTSEYRNIIPVVVNSKSYLGINAILVMNVKEEFFHDLVEDKAHPDDINYILDESGKVITHADRDFLYKTNPDMDILIRNGAKVGRTPVEYKGVKYVLYQKKSEYVNCTVYSLIAEKDFYHGRNSILGLLLLISVLLLLAGLFTAYVFSGKLYSPIRNLINIMYDHEDENSKNLSFREFEMIKENFRGLQSSNAGLTASVGKIIPYMHIVKSFMVFGNQTVNEKEILDLLTDDKIKLDKKYFLVSAFVLFYKPEFTSSFPEAEQNSIKGGILNMVKEIIRNKFLESIIIDFEDGKHMVIINSDDPLLYESYYRIAESFYNILKEDRRFIQLLMSVGSQIDSIGMLPKEFSKVNEALESINVNDWKPHTDASAGEGVDDDALPLYLEEKLNNIVSSGAINEIEKIVDEVIKEYFNSGLTIGRFRKFYKNFSDICLRIASRHSLSIPELNDLKTKTVFRDMDLEGIKRQFSALLHKMSSHLQTPEIGKKDILISYLEEHYMDENICIESMAADLHFHPNYLSRMFKSEIGSYFSDYLSSLRIERAKDLIVDSNLTIDEISKKVGINNRSTFNRLYKKYTGVSPAAYRAIHE